MSYNGVGLQTPRGTGTSGYIQKNVANKHVEGYRQKRARDASEAERREARARMKVARRSAGTEVKEHLDKRRVEVKCMELRDQLEDEDVDEETIQSKVDELRKSLLSLPAKSDASEEPTEGFHEISRRELVEREDMEKRTKNVPCKDDTETSEKKPKIKTQETLKEKTVEDDKGKGTDEDDVSQKENSGNNEKGTKVLKSEDTQSSNLEEPKNSSAYNYVPRYGKR